MPGSVEKILRQPADWSRAKRAISWGLTATDFRLRARNGNPFSGGGTMALNPEGEAKALFGPRPHSPCYQIPRPRAVP